MMKVFTTTLLIAISLGLSACANEVEKSKVAQPERKTLATAPDPAPVAKPRAKKLPPEKDYKGEGFSLNLKSLKMGLGPIGAPGSVTRMNTTLYFHDYEDHAMTRLLAVDMAEVGELYRDIDWTFNTFRVAQGRTYEGKIKLTSPKLPALTIEVFGSSYGRDFQINKEEILPHTKWSAAKGPIDLTFATIDTKGKLTFTPEPGKALEERARKYIGQ